MQRQDFLAELMAEGKLELVEPSGDIARSYVRKAENSLKSARVLLQNSLLEDSISMSYYAMYNSLTALLYKAGIKCENHQGSIMLLKYVFRKDGLHNVIAEAKKDRIDSQYYVRQDDVTSDAAKRMITEAEDFSVQIRIVMDGLNADAIRDKREKLKSIGGIR